MHSECKSEPGIIATIIYVCDLAVHGSKTNSIGRALRGAHCQQYVAKEKHGFCRQCCYAHATRQSQRAFTAARCASKRTCMRMQDCGWGSGRRGIGPAGCAQSCSTLAPALGCRRARLCCTPARHAFDPGPPHPYSAHREQLGAASAAAGAAHTVRCWRVVSFRQLVAGTVGGS